MNHLTTITCLCLSLLFIPSASAQTPSEELGSCLIDSLNGKERKALAKWIYFAMGSHPDIKSFMNASETTINDSDKYVGQLITKILTKDCPNQTRDAYQADPTAIQQAFELVGKVAMQELMASQETMKALTNYIQYANTDEINKLLRD